MYGNNFAYFDPNIWWNEDEMRKQVEQLNVLNILNIKIFLEIGILQDSLNLIFKYIKYF